MHGRRVIKALQICHVYYGEQGLDEMLHTRRLFSVLVTPYKCYDRGIINHTLLEKPSPHAVVINVARGQHVVEQDLLTALNNESLRAATLDVFDQEPLKNDHPYWQHPKITLTPHCAALSDLNSVINQIVENIERFNEGRKLNNLIDRTKGY